MRCVGKGKNKNSRSNISWAKIVRENSRLLVALRFSRSEITRFARDNTGHRPPRGGVLVIYRPEISLFRSPALRENTGGGLNYHRCDYYFIRRTIRSDTCLCKKRDNEAYEI